LTGRLCAALPCHGIASLCPWRVEVWWNNFKISSAWLSSEMARALAAVCPPLKTADVVQVADSLTAHAKPTRVIGRMLLPGADLMQVRRVVAALRALRDVAA
jgi:hypothetical protein